MKDKNKNTMFDKFSNSPLAKVYSKLPLWGKVAVPAVAFILFLTIFKMLKTVFFVGIIAVVVFAVLSMTAKMKKKD
jgi:hypothetical protein